MWAVPCALGLASQHALGAGCGCARQEQLPPLWLAAKHEEVTCGVHLLKICASPGALFIYSLNSPCALNNMRCSFCFGELPVSLLNLPLLGIRRHMAEQWRRWHRARTLP